MPAVVERFVLHWGEMGDRWGVNRSVSQVHALLFMSDRPLCAEDIADTLAMARSNVSTSLRELLAWSLIKRASLLGDRRDYYEAEADMLEMIRRIALGRKARELDPTLALLRACAADAERDKDVPGPSKARLKQMLDVMERVDKSFSEVMRLPPSVLSRLIRMGGAIARVVTPSATKKG